MYHKGSSLESGIGSEDTSDSAVRNFFDTFVNKLGTAVQGHRGLDMDDIEDPTIDLDDLDNAGAMAIPSSPIPHKNRQPTARRASEPVSNRQAAQRQIMDKPKNCHQTFNVAEKVSDPGLSELEVIVAQLRNKSPYGEKLTGIMLKNLEKTLNGDLYRIFIDHGLPDNWLPIVKMNNDNTPYVEFLIKSDISDQSPDDQISGYSGAYMALCNFVLHHVQSYGARQKISSTNQLQQKQQQQPPRIQNKASKIQSQTFNHKQLEVAVHHKENRASLPTPMACSTPKAQRKAPVKRNPASNSSRALEDSLNDSKRILPPRACKTSSIFGPHRRV